MRIPRGFWILAMGIAVGAASCPEQVERLGQTQLRPAQSWTAIVPVMRDGIEPSTWQESTEAIVETLRDRGIDARAVPSLQQAGAVKQPYLQVSASVPGGAFENRACRVRAQVVPIGANLPALSSQAARDDLEQSDCIRSAVDMLVKAMVEAGY